jgi:hypothetical protein
MADINIERKSGAGNVIPWIIGLLVLALIAWWLLAGRGDDDVDDGTYVDTVTAPAAATADPYGAPDTVMGTTLTPVPGADTPGGVPDTTLP